MGINSEHGLCYKFFPALSLCNHLSGLNLAFASLCKALNAQGQWS